MDPEIDFMIWNVAFSTCYDNLSFPPFGSFKCAEFADKMLCQIKQRNNAPEE